jgi:hypothetical protein
MSALHAVSESKIQLSECVSFPLVLKTGFLCVHVHVCVYTFKTTQKLKLQTVEQNE